MDEITAKTAIDDSDNVLAMYGTNISVKVSSGALEPIFGREAKFDRIFQILTRRRKNNALLVGESGVGKNINCARYCFAYS